MKIYISALLSMLCAFGYSQITEVEILADGVVFPRMNTVQRNALSAIQGQCIYNTQNNALECYNGTAWSSNTNGMINSHIIDGDGDTSIELEQTSDEDVIHFTTAGTEVMKHDGQTLHMLNNGESVFIGEDAGKSDDLTGNQNTVIGYRAAEDLTTGTQNVSIGNQALRDNVSGSTNIAIGKEALAKGNGSNNIAIGHNAGRDMSNLTTKNTVIGGFAGFAHQEGEANVMLGYEAGKSLIYGEGNVFLGERAGTSLIGNVNDIFSARDNIFIGRNAGSFFQEGFRNTLINGSVSSGDLNIVMGGFLGASSSRNVIIGGGEDWYPGFKFNTAIGYNTANSNGALVGSGRYNTFVGANTGMDQNGSFGVVLGAYTNGARGFSTGGFNNVVIGNNATESFEGTLYDNTLIIESDTTFSPNTAEAPLIYGRFDTDLIEINGTLAVKDLPISSSSSDLRVDSNGKLVLSSSDARLKNTIEPIKGALEKVSQLEGVTFIWNDDPSVGKQIGLIAQDVLEVVPEIVTNHEGLLGVDYTESIGLLIEAIKELNTENSELKEQQKNLEANIQELIKKTERLTVGMDGPEN